MWNGLWYTEPCWDQACISRFNAFDMPTWNDRPNVGVDVIGMVSLTLPMIFVTLTGTSVPT